MFEDVHSTLVHQQAILTSLQTKGQAFRSEIAHVQASIKKFNDQDLRVRTLQREIDLEDTKYRKYSDNLEQARIDQGLELGRISNITVAQPPTYEPKPIRPRKLLNLLLGLGVGVAGWNSGAGGRRSHRWRVSFAQRPFPETSAVRCHRIGQPSFSRAGQP